MGVRGDMEPGDSLYRTRNGKSSMVYTSKVYKPVLLPFEKQLIDSIGATEEEYRYLVAEAIKKGRVRPAGYEHIPDIRATGIEITTAKVTAALINIAIGAAISYAIYLLTPKPKPQKDERLLLDSINKGGRFTPTWGFDSQMELANYQEPIPIVFGKAIFENEIHKSGGVLMTPRMVWSRLFSYGSQQGVKYMMILGEEGEAGDGIAVPDLEGIFLGSTPLDALYDSHFAFYWRRHSWAGQGSRIWPVHKRYGTNGTVDSGDPDTPDTGGDVVLRVPTSRGNHDPQGFSSVRSLTNNSEFGCYAPIANGTVYRVNWQVVNWIRISDAPDDPGAVKELTVAKIAGDHDWGGQLYDSNHMLVRLVNRIRNRYNGMPGTGRNYSRRMGILTHRRNSDNALTECSNSDIKKTITNISKGDHIEFIIKPSGVKLGSDFYGDKVKVDDIVQQILSYRQEADDTFQLGETFMIGDSVWQVFRRGLDEVNKIWTEENDEEQVIGLKCIDAGPSEVDRKIGIVAEGVLNPTLDKGFKGGFVSDSPQNRNIPGSPWYPLTKVAIASIKNTRECETTEIGIKSRVFQNLNGLFNFQSILTPAALGDLWHDKVSVEGGVINASIKRSSCFRVLYRKADHSAEEKDWIDFGIIFAVVGSNQIDQYNQIRIRHPNLSRYEYQMRPISGATMAYREDADVVYNLTTSGPAHTIESHLFRIEFKGVLTTKSALKSNKEFRSEGVVTPEVTTTVRKPSVISQKGFVTGKEDWDDVSQIETCEWQSNYGGTGSGDVGGYGLHGAFTWELFGNPTTDSTPRNGTKEGTFDFTATNNKPVKLKIKVKKSAMDKATWLPSGLDDGWVIVGIWNTDRREEGIVPVNTDNGRNLDWQPGNTFKIQKTCAGSNLFAANAENGPLTYAGIEVKVNSISYVHDVYRGKDQAVLKEVFGSAESENLHSSKTMEITMKNTGMDNSWKTNLPAGRTVRVKFHGTVISYIDRYGGHWTGQHRGWELNRIEVNTSHSDSTGSDTTWSKGGTFDFYKDSAGSPYWRTEQGKIGWVLEVNELQPIITPATESSDRIFEHNSQLSDISLYGDLVTKSNDSSPEHVVTYVNEILSNDDMPTYANMTTSALSLRASRAFSQLDQVRVWLKEGVKVENLHPDDSSATAASNLFTDLVYYLLTDRTAGGGRLLSDNAIDTDLLINKTELISTSKFLRKKELFFNGAISSPINVREYISATAPYFLCSFVISNGKFSIKPVLPVHDDGEIDSTSAITLKQLFTAGNILADSYKLDYIGSEERRDFRATVRYRKESKNQLPEEVALEVRRGDSRDEDLPVESFDLTQFCTTESHALLVAKYFLSVRKHVTHTITFSTTPYGLDLAPGEYIKVSTESSPYNAANNGTISSAGAITSVRNIDDGTYNVLYYKTDSDQEDVKEGTIQIENMSVSDTATFGSSIFVLKQTIESQNIYRVEQIMYTEDNTVEIVASEFPCNSERVSLMAQELISGEFVDSSGRAI